MVIVIVLLKSLLHNFCLTNQKGSFKMRFVGKPIEILIVEDNEGDVGLIEEVFEEAKIKNNIHVAEDGEEAVLYLRGKGKFSGSPRPDIIILDLNLPNKDGREVLKEIKEDENLKNIPVVVLTTSGAEKDIIRAYELHANAYVTKPIDFDQFINVIGSIVNFWLEIVKLPSK